MRKMVETYCKTDIGLKRSQNEDICAVDPDRKFLVVADGMGGAARGDVASKLFLSTVKKVFSIPTPTQPSLKERFYACFEDEGETLDDQENKILDTVKDKVYSCFEQTNNSIHAHVKKIPAHEGMGCTAELLTFWKSYYVIGHVGDSRTYLYSQHSSLRQLTKDHSLVQEQVDSGNLHETQAETSRLRNVLTKAIGVKPHQEMDLITGQVQPGDIFLLCSDGLYNMVNDKEIEDVLAFDGPLELKAEILINMANDAGGKDNISVALAAIPPTVV